MSVSFEVNILQCGQVLLLFCETCTEDNISTDFQDQLTFSTNFLSFHVWVSDWSYFEIIETYV